MASEKITAIVEEIKGLTLLELNESKIRFHKAESDLLQARYEYLYRCKIIEFYRNEED